MRTFRILFKSAIALFCLWHMAAIGIYSLQNVDSQPVLKWLESKQYIVRSYVLMTSQWQRWNLFSPDPLRRVITMNVEADTPMGSRIIRVLDFEHLSYFRRAAELKVMRRMEEENQEPLKNAYLQDVCRTEQLPLGTPIRLTKRYQVIPKHDVPQTVRWWMQWEPIWQEHLEQATVCGAPLVSTAPAPDPSTGEL